MSKEISLKSTKEQILAAYTEALEQLKKQKLTPVEEKAFSNKAKQVEEIKQYGYERLHGELGQIGSSFSKSLETFSESITNEYAKFLKLQEAIKTEQQHLDDLYSIKESANTLSSLIIANARQKEEFSSEMNIEQEKWKARLIELDNEFKFKKTELEKQRKREEEEYTYSLTQKRRTETDQYEQKKQEQLRELLIKQQDIQIREKSIIEQENQFMELQTKLANIEEETHSKVKFAEEEVAKVLQQEFKFSQALKDEQAKARIELLQQKVESTLEKVAEQESVIAQLNSRLQLAQEQAQQIAHKALETSTQRNMVINPGENPSKQQGI
jgi:hypothetical protein